MVTVLTLKSLESFCLKRVKTAILFRRISLYVFFLPKYSLSPHGGGECQIPLKTLVWSESLPEKPRLAVMGGPRALLLSGSEPRGRGGRREQAHCC